MNREQLRLYLRRHQLVDSDLGNIVVQCNPDGTATYVPGTVDQTWVEFTPDSSGVDKLALSWDEINTSASSQNSETNPGGSNFDKGITLEVTLYNRAFQFVYDWLLSERCGILNSVDALITDDLCGRSYRLFEIKADNLQYRPFGAPCEVTVKLREADPVWHCVHKTFIWDNWQHWFEDNSAKEHPCFLTAVEPRPRLISSARMGLSIFGQTVPIISLFFSENDNVFRRILNVDNFVEAPLVRDVISNACDKCGLQVDTIFHDPESPYYNLTLYYPLAGQWHINDADDVESPALWFHLGNRWDITLAEFLDLLKVPFHAQWYVTPNATLVFKNEVFFANRAPILDLSTDTTMALWDNTTLEYTFDGNKKAAYGRYQYTIDPSDLASQEIQPLYNDITDYDGPSNNPMLEGSISKTLDFASTGFVRDGKARGDYMRDLINDGETVAYALLVLLGVVVASLLAGVLTVAASVALGGFLAAWVIAVASKASDLRTLFGDEVYTGAVRITADQVGKARLLLWDGESLERAKVVKVAPGDIEPSPYYNPLLVDYATRNTVQYNPVGGLFIFNYPMYFDSDFLGNLFDRFQDELDNPLKSLDTHQSAEFEVNLCCDLQTVLGVWEGDFAKIGYRIKVETRDNYDVFVEIAHFDVDYDRARIKVRGKVFKEQTTTP